MNAARPADGDDDRFVAVGRIAKAHGVRGDVFVEPWTDAPDERFAVGAVLRQQSGSELTVADWRDHSGKLIVHFDGVDDRNAADALRGAVLMIEAAGRPPLDDPDEFYDTDLVGLTVTLP